MFSVILAVPAASHPSPHSFPFPRVPFSPARSLARSFVLTKLSGRFSFLLRPHAVPDVFSGILIRSLVHLSNFVILAKMFESTIPSYLRGALRFSNNVEDGHGPFRSPDNRSPCNAEDECSYSLVRKSKCSLDNNSDGKPVMKCEKTEQRLKHCLGRPVEVVESKTEYTEEDAVNAKFSIWDHDSIDEVPSFRPEHSPFKMPPSSSSPSLEGIPADIESVFKVAEEFFNEAFNKFPLHGSDEDGEMMGSHGYLKKYPPERRSSKDPASSGAGVKEHSKPQKTPDYSELSNGFEEV